MATKTPPEFVLNFSSLTLLSAEEIRLAKRDTDSPQLVIALENCLLRLCETDDLHEINKTLQRFGYPRGWSSSVRERLTAISFLVIMRNIEPKKRAFDIPEHCSAFPNLSLLWCQHFFPLYPLATVAFPLIPTRDTNIQGYGRISQKLRLLKNLEQCHSRLLKKITTKLKHLLNQSLSEGTSPDHRFLLEHCQGFLMPPSPSGSSQEGSLRKLREEVRTVEELTEDSYRKQQYLEKYFEWVGVDASPSPEFSFDSSTRSFSEELIQSAGMVASIESILPLLLVNKKYTFPPPSNEENQKRSIKVSTDVCLRHLCLAAIQNLERMSPTKCGLDGLDSEVTILPHIACRAIVDPNLELSLSSFLCLPPQPSEEIERALHHLRQSNNEVIQKTIAATKKYSLFEFDTLRKI